MKRIALTSVLLASGLVHADEWHNALLGICNEENDTYKIEYHGKYNEEGQAMVADIKSRTQDTCKLSDGVYELKPRFFYLSSDGMGRCGAHEFVEIHLVKGEKTIYKSLVEDDCMGESKRISSVTISPSSQNKITVE